MADQTYKTLKLVGIHEPETHHEVIDAHTREKVELPGMYHIGALIDGAFVKIVTLKAGDVLEAVERAKSKSDKPEDDEE